MTHRTRPLLGALLLGLIAVPAAAQRAPSGPAGPADPRALREGVRAYRASHEAEIVRELTDFLSIPNVASDESNIRRNAQALVAMLGRRGVTARRMKDIFEAFRAAIPGVTIRTTVLVGFPGESEAHLQNLLAFIEDVGFDRLGVFTYSLEDGTPAATMADQVPPELMAERARIVQDAQDRMVWERQKNLYGVVQTVLVDGRSEDPAFPWEGRLAGQAPEIDGVVYLRDLSLTPGRFARVRIVEVEGYELVGESAD